MRGKESGRRTLVVPAGDVAGKEVVLIVLEAILR